MQILWLITRACAMPDPRLLANPQKANPQHMMSEEREAMLYIMGFTLLIVCVGLLLV